LNNAETIVTAERLHIRRFNVADAESMVAPFADAEVMH
tara:strand:+ start:3526 stop:3639 length:114 start_codon:yes stop_codon:yes gene_type:complete